MNRRLVMMTTAALVIGLGMFGCAKKDAGPAGASETDVSGAAGAGGDGAGGAGGLSLPIVHFEFDQAVIRSSDRPLLKTAAEGLKGAGAIEVTIEGHCDERGSVEYNLALGERRARAVKSYLVRLGVDGNHLRTLSYGEERPANVGSSEASWAENRRAELIANR